MVKGLDFAGWRMAAVLAVLALMMGRQTAQADPRDQVVTDVMHCAAITDSRQWLECFYGAAQPMRAYLNLSPAPESQQQLLRRYSSSSPANASARASRISSPPPPPKEQGFFGRLFGGTPVVVNVPMRAYSFNPDGTFVVTLENGEVWQQRSGDNGGPHMRWKGPAASLRASITTGVGSSYNMKVNGGSNVYKVSRLR